MNPNHFEIHTGPALPRRFAPSNGKTSPTRQLLRGTLVLGLFLGNMSQARSAAMYWSDLDGGDIQRANLDGTGQKILISGLSSPAGPALNLTGGKIYWGTDGSSISTANLDSTGKRVLYTGSVSAPSVDVGRGRLYWTDPSGKICNSDLSGSDVNVLVQGLNDPHGPIFLDTVGGKMYWTDFGDGDIRRASLSGGGQKTLVEGLAGPDHIALDVAGGKMYWTDQGSGDIQRANLDGTGPELLVQNLNAPSGIALDVSSGLMYWTEYAGGTIKRANLDGTSPKTLITGLSGPSVITLDLSVLTPPSIQPGSKSDSTFALNWSALRGRGYQVQFKANLTQANWTDSGGPRTATSTVMTASPNIGSDPQQFYRVVLLP